MPAGTDYASPFYAVTDDQVDLLFDITYQAAEETIIKQEIFETIFAYIDSAQSYILLDMFLFNSYIGKQDQAYRQLSNQLADLLIDKALVDSVTIDFITDPINTVYEGDISPELFAMQTAGINVIYTDLDKLPDSNLLYSPIWRTFIRWFGNSRGGAIFPHPFGDDQHKVTLRTYFRLLNFKANHRKVFVADYRDDWVSVVTSANPHNGSSAHSNLGLLVHGAIAAELWQAEQAVADFSAAKLSRTISHQAKNSGEILLKVISERKIRDELLQEINYSAVGDSIKIGMFYLSDRQIIKALLAADRRGVNCKLILDAGKDAFGRKKNGVPNRPVAHELRSKSSGSIVIKWYNTQGEQYHSKFAYFQRSGRTDSIILGSANFTKRNLGNKNLELNILLQSGSQQEIMQEMAEYFDLLWYNDNITLDYEAYGTSSLWKKLLYRFTEKWGTSTY
ncbi:MAG: phospholipase D-like domain-containing protein [Candidatus Cloacimonadales bacterium]